MPENNERAVLVRVTRDKLRVLLLCGAPTWDTRFLRAFLKADPSIDLITFFILRTSSDLTMASPEELSLIPFPTDELFREHLDSFDIVHLPGLQLRAVSGRGLPAADPRLRAQAAARSR